MYFATQCFNRSWEQSHKDCPQKQLVRTVDSTARQSILLWEPGTTSLVTQPTGSARQPILLWEPGTTSLVTAYGLRETNGDSDCSKESKIRGVCPFNFLGTEGRQRSCVTTIVSGSSCQSAQYVLHSGVCVCVCVCVCLSVFCCCFFECVCVCV